MAPSEGCLSPFETELGRRRIAGDWLPSGVPALCPPLPGKKKPGFLQAILKTVSCETPASHWGTTLALAVVCAFLPGGPVMGWVPGCHGRPG